MAQVPAVSNFEAALRIHLELLNEELRQAREDVKRLEQRIAGKERHIRLLGELLGEQGGGKSSPTAAPPLVPNILKSARGVLAECGEPLHYRRITALLADQGVFIPGKDPGTNLLAYLCKDAGFKRVGRGVYALAEDGASKPRTRKARRRRAIKAKRRR